MAVFTVVNARDFSDWAMRHYRFRQVEVPVPISDGIENTNYRFIADGNPYVFTIFEVWDSPVVTYYTALMHHLYQENLPVLAALDMTAGGQVGDWSGKPCVVVPFVSGTAISRPSPPACHKIGALVADLHIAARHFSWQCDTPRDNPRNHAWRNQTAVTLQPLISASQQTLLAAALARDADFSAAPLPKGACHCDLFRNNVLWHDDAVAAVIDFYFGGEDALIFDLAVCICDWCFFDGDFSPPHLRALVEGYVSRRQLTDLEKALFSDALCVAATRFWLSRLYDIHFPRRAAYLTPHDPQHFETILGKTCLMQRDINQLLTGTA